MTIHFYKLCVLCLFFFFKSALNAQDAKPYKSSIHETSFTDIALTPGHHLGKLKVKSHGTYWNYDLTVPEIQPYTKVPLIIVLHGGMGSKNYTKFSECLVAPGLKDSGGIIFSPSGAWRTWTLPYLEQRILDVIDLAKTHWPIDPERIILVGYSNGAIGGWKYAKRHPKVFSAMILMASSCKVTTALEMPIYVIQGTKDRFFPIRKVQKRIAKAKALGCKITFVPAKGNTHIKACDYKDALQASADWLHHEVWKNN